MSDLEQRLEQRLRAAAPRFDPVPLAAVAERVRRRRRATGAVSVAGVVLAAVAAIAVPRLTIGAPGVQTVDSRGGAMAPATGTDSAAGGGTGSTGSQAAPPAGSGTPPASTGAGCPPRMTGNTIVDYVDFVELGGRQYVRLNNQPDTVPASALGARLGTVRCTLSTIRPDPSYHPKDGDAGYLAAGTPLYAIDGYPATDRLAAPVGGRYLSYRVYPYRWAAGTARP